MIEETALLAQQRVNPWDLLRDQLFSRFGSANLPPISCDIPLSVYFLWSYSKSQVVHWKQTLLAAPGFYFQLILSKTTIYLSELNFTCLKSQTGIDGCFTSNDSSTMWGYKLLIQNGPFVRMGGCVLVQNNTRNRTLTYFVPKTAGSKEHPIHGTVGQVVGWPMCTSCDKLIVGGSRFFR